ncbi:hypothetical protein ACFY1U_03010 [Streptomyces sp. NPDC001351]|uniref:hypothetical protein n=1 Tax=Streptomyces sp. NPDC001351 TaxID=3364564 RepID=UPI0036B56A4B
MENPFRDGGPAEKVMPYLSLIISAILLAEGVRMHREGASLFWPLGASFLMLSACHAIYRQIRSQRERV